jgi:hypothetical protein
VITASENGFLLDWSRQDLGNGSPLKWPQIAQKGRSAEKHRHQSQSGEIKVQIVITQKQSRSPEKVALVADFFPFGMAFTAEPLSVIAKSLVPAFLGDPFYDPGVSYLRTPPTATVNSTSSPTPGSP